jgi:hypothetical protein
MQILTHKQNIIKLTIAAFLLLTGRASAQGEVAEQLGHLIDDALFYSDKYVTPAVDAAVYQSASGWMATPKKRELWDVTVAVHANVFFTPKRDREFMIDNSDFTFFQLENGTSAIVPTALGNDYQVYLIGQLGDDEIRIENPEGVDMEVVGYPYLQASAALWYGTEVIVKISPRVKFRERDFRVYGAGIKHNFSQYFSSLEEKKVHLAALVSYSKEDVSTNFLDINTSYGNLGFTRIQGTVDTWQLQLNGSKEFGKFEVMAGFLINTSDIEYKVGGPKGSIEEIIPVQDVLNKRLEEIYKTRINYIGEASLSYNMGHFDVQAILAFGKFVNSNISLQYSFD